MAKCWTSTMFLFLFWCFLVSSFSVKLQFTRLVALRLLNWNGFAKCGCNFCHTNSFFCKCDFDLSAQRRTDRKSTTKICQLKCEKVDNLMWFIVNQVKVKARISIAIIYSKSQCDQEKSVHQCDEFVLRSRCFALGLVELVWSFRHRYLPSEIKKLCASARALVFVLKSVKRIGFIGVKFRTKDRSLQNDICLTRANCLDKQKRMEGLYLLRYDLLWEFTT